MWFVPVFTFQNVARRARVWQASEPDGSEPQPGPDPRQGRAARARNVQSEPDQWSRRVLSLRTRRPGSEPAKDRGADVVPFIERNHAWIRNQQEISNGKLIHALPIRSHER